MFSPKMLEKFSFLLFARAVPKLLTHHTLTLPSGRGNSMAFRSDTGIQTDGLSWFFGRKGGTGVAGWMCFLVKKKDKHHRARYWLNKKYQQGQPFWLCVFTLKGRCIYFNCLVEKN